MELTDRVMHVSAGAVIYSKEGVELQIVLLFRARTNTYHLPKGTAHPDENLQTTALREIKEETGFEVRINSYLGEVYSSFKRADEIIKKQTHYFIAEMVGGNSDLHDAEHDTVLLVPIAEARGLLENNGGHRLGYEDERNIIDLFAKHWGLIGGV